MLSSLSAFSLQWNEILLQYLWTWQDGWGYPCFQKMWHRRFHLPSTASPQSQLCQAVRSPESFLTATVQPALCKRVGVWPGQGEAGLSCHQNIWNIWTDIYTGKSETDQSRGEASFLRKQCHMQGHQATMLWWLQGLKVSKVYFIQIVETFNERESTLVITVDPARRAVIQRQAMWKCLWLTDQLTDGLNWVGAIDAYASKKIIDLGDNSWSS